MSLRAKASIGVLFLLVASCRSSGPGAEQARLEVEGSATVVTVDGDRRTVEDSTTLDFGDVVTVDDGTATLELAAGQRYELRAGVSGQGDTELVVGAPPLLRAGDVLVDGGFPAPIRLETATVTAQGALKVRADVPEASAYAGRARINGAGELDEVRGLRRVVLTPSATPEPLAYDGTDPWDRRFLGEAIAFGERLEALARGYTGDLQPGPQRSARFYEQVLPALAEEREFGADLLDDRPPGETLVGAAIAIQGRDGSFRDRWDAVFSFRDAGAAWGLVALDQGVSSAPVLDSIELAIGQSPLSDEPRPTTTTSRIPPPTSTTGSTPPTTGSPPPTTTPPEQPPPDQGGPLDPVTTPVEAILQDVFEALGFG